MAHFITENCIGCTLCMKNCPVKAISGTVKLRHVINAARCVDCGVCGRVCTKGAILDASGNPCLKSPRPDWLIPVIDTVLCSACEMCVEICGKDALKLSLPTHRGDISVFVTLNDEKACVGCGICANTCPLHAITMERKSAL